MKRVLIISTIVAIILSLSACTSGQIEAERELGQQTKIVYAKWKVKTNGKTISEIKIAGVDSNESILLFDHPEKVLGVKLSPNHKKLVFITEAKKVFVSDLDGNNIVNIEASISGWPCWSPNSKKLAYINYDRINKSSLIVYTLKDQKKQTIYLRDYRQFPCGVMDWHPKSGQIMVYVSGEGKLQSSLIGIDVKSDQINKIATNAVLRGIGPRGAMFIVRPIVKNPNSRNSYDLKSAGVTWEAWRHTEGVGLSKILGGLKSSMAAWSDDGQRMVYSKAFDQYGTQLYVADAYGHGEKRLTSLPQHQDFFPMWAADDRYIVFSAVNTGPKKPGSYIFKYDLDANKLIPLFGNNPTSFGVPFAVY